MSLYARNGLWLSRSASNATGAPWAQTPARTDGVLEAVASGVVTLASTGADVRVASAASNVYVGAGATVDVLRVTPTAVLVNGVAQVTDLVVSNKLAVLGASSSPSNSADVRLAAADGAGLLVSLSNEDGTRLERSLRWRLGAVRSSAEPSNVAAAGGASNGPRWEFRGGSLWLTAPVAAGVGGYATNEAPPSSRARREVTFGWRVNEYDEVELFKRVCASNSADGTVKESFRSVARFGGAIGCNVGIVLPTSVDPWYGFVLGSNATVVNPGTSIGGSSNSNGSNVGGTSNVSVITAIITGYDGSNDGTSTSAYIPTSVVAVKNPLPKYYSIIYGDSFIS